MRVSWRQLALLSDEGQAVAWRQCAWSELREVLVEYVKLAGVKVAADACGVDEATLGNAINGRNRNAFKLEWLPVLLRLAPDTRALSIIARQQGYELVARRELTAEQRLERLERADRAAMPRHADDLLDEAYGPDD